MGRRMCFQPRMWVSAKLWERLQRSAFGRSRPGQHHQFLRQLGNVFSVIATLTRINARERAGHEFARTVAFESLVVHGPCAYAVLCEGEASDDISPINDGRKGMRITLHNAEAADRKSTRLNSSP